MERLQKIIASAGLCSRRAAEGWITAGRVSVNGEVVKVLGTKADPQKDKIEIEGYGEISVAASVYIMMHKPQFVMSTLDDPEGRKTVVDIIHESRAVGQRRFEGELPRVYPVGRLDFDAEGLLLLTNDGDFAQRLSHPRHHVPRTYAVKIKGRPEERQLERVRGGCTVPADGEHPGFRSRPCDIRVTRYSERNTWLEMTLFQGRYHQVKRLCRLMGTPVIRLVRTDVGELHVDALPPGAWRFLSRAEVENLLSMSKSSGGQSDVKRSPRKTGAKTAKNKSGSSKSPARRTKESSTSKKSVGSSGPRRPRGKSS